MQIESGSVCLVAGEAIGESIAVVGKLPDACDGGAAVGFAHDLPGVGSLDGDGQRRADEGRLVGSVGYDSLDVVAGEGEGSTFGSERLCLT